MSYATEDFSESLRRVAIEQSDIASIEAAWGSGNGSDGHHRHGDDSGTEWSGGFLLKLKDGTFAYLTGWCDYTGWGCQDGAEIHLFAERPTLQALRDVGEGGPEDDEWDMEPADLNRWLVAPAGDSAHD